MAVLKVVLIFSVIPAILSQCTVEKAEPLFKRSVYEFSVELLSRVAFEKENHFIASTFSIWIILACASLGAEGETLNELKQILLLNKNKCFNNKYLEIASSVVSNNNTDVILERSASLFVDQKISLTKYYETKLRKTSIANIVSTPFENPEEAAYTINDYVRRATHETIKEIVSSDDLDNTLLIMLDAIFFKGSWTKSFAVENTEIRTFYNEEGVAIGDVSLMFINSEFRAGLISQIEALVLELPYGDSDRYSMLLFLPLDRVPLYNVIMNLKLINLASINNFLSNKLGTVQVQIPRFKISSDLNNLKELLIDMGLNSIFDDTANFSKLSDSPLYITNFIQKADIEVTEEGTVASAVTAAEFSFRSMPFQFEANKPFLFMIVDKQLEVPLFTGAYSKPTLYQ